MGLILVKDTETTGLPVWGEPSEGVSQPHLVQLAAILVDEDTRVVVDKMDVTIKPNGWSWGADNEAFKVHGVTMERAMAEGVEEEAALRTFLDLWKRAVFRVGHNCPFDNRMIRITICRYIDKTFADVFKAQEYQCTGLLSKGILKMPAPPKAKRFGPYKMPKLEEAYEFFFPGKKIVGQHSAMGDTQACMEIYFAIQDHNDSRS